MVIHIKKWGNSAFARIPASVMAAASLSLDQAVEVRHEGSRVIIEPVLAPTYSLKDLVARMDPDTFPEDDAFSTPMGKEIW